MKISELAKQSGFTIDTIRFYEKIGLINSSHYARKENNYRDYHAAALDRLELIKNGQAAGFTLGEIAQAADAWEANAISTDEKITYFTQKISEIDAQITRLQAIRVYLGKKIEMFQTERSSKEGTPAEQRA